MTEQISSTPLIDHIPSTAELAMQYGPSTKHLRSSDTAEFTYEPVHSALVVDPSFEAAEQSAETRMATQIGLELAWGPEDQRSALIRDAYGVARQYGDHALAEISSDAVEVLDASRGVRNGMAYVDQSKHANGSQASGYVTERRTNEGNMRLELGISVNDTLPGSEQYDQLLQQVEASGVVMNPNDLSTLLFLQTVGHETGHVIQRGIASDMASVAWTSGRGEISESDTFGAQMLMLGVTESTTGNLQTDVAIYDEQFAEGYGIMVMAKAAEALGYDTESIRKLEQLMKLTEEQLGHVEHLAEVSGSKGLVQILGEKGIVGNPGEIGYTRPLTSQQIATSLNTVMRTYQERSMPELTQEAYGRLSRIDPLLLSISSKVWNQK